MSRILVTAGRSPLGRRVLEILESSPDVEWVRGIEAHAAHGVEDPNELEILPFVPDHRRLAAYLVAERVDGVVQCGLVPDRSGVETKSRDADVIATMCLGAAIGSPGSPVRSWVLASSTAIYPIGSHSPLMQREHQPLPFEEGTLSATIAEAEEYARDLAHRLPHVNVAILRLQQLIGTGALGPLARLIARDPVPVPLGFDPPIQLLHVDDAASALDFAARSELAGIYNVASKGLLHWNDAVRATSRRLVPVLPMPLGLLDPVLDRLGLPYVPADLYDLMRFGHVVDTEKIEAAGWKAQYDQRDCLATLRRR